MAWIMENRRQATFERLAEPYLTEELKAELAGKYFPRYPTKRACTLPVLHAIQHAYGWIPPQAIEETAAFLELSPAEVLDTASFYEEYWLKPKGKYLIAICRSLACELCGANQLLAAVSRKLGIDPGETTPDGKFTLMAYECLGSCGTAPAALVNEVLHEDITLANFAQLLDGLPDDPHAYHDPTITWEDGGH
jgi:NADH-quinone oxidoreductase subunit E